MKLSTLATSLFLALAASLPAEIISVTGPNSSVGAAPMKIAAPCCALNNNVINTGMQGFDEAQNVLLTSAIETDGAPIAAGTYVDSHMIFLNSQGLTLIEHGGVTWTFDAPIIGVMSNNSGSLEFDSTNQLGAPGPPPTVYQPSPLNNRGLEGNNRTGLGASDGYKIMSANQIRVSMRVTEPGDWIRVVTQVPEPGFYGMLAMGLAGLYFFRRRRETFDLA